MYISGLIYSTSSTRWVEVVWDRFPGGKVTNLIFSYFDCSIEVVVGREADIRSSMVNCS